MVTISDGYSFLRHRGEAAVSLMRNRDPRFSQPFFQHKIAGDRVLERVGDKRRWTTARAVYGIESIFWARRAF